MAVDLHISKPTIFLSHNRKDKALARRLGDELSRAGAQVWIDEAEIKVGDSLIRKIGEGIESCDFLGVVLSPDSVASEWVRREVEIAMNMEIAGKRVVVLPLLCRKCEIPVFLSDKFYADFTERKTFIPSLKLIKERLGLPITPTTLPVDEQTDDLLYQIRAPLRIARAYLRWTTHELGLTQQTREQLSKIQFLLERAELIMARFRLLQAYAKGQYPSYPVPGQNVLDLVKRLVTLVIPGIHPRRNIKFDVEGSFSPRATLDRALFEVAVTNLLDNAIKYSYSDTVVRIICSEEMDSVQVHFLSEGLPINQSDEDRIFELGFRGRGPLRYRGRLRARVVSS